MTVASETAVRKARDVVVLRMSSTAEVDGVIAAVRIDEREKWAIERDYLLKLTDKLATELGECGRLVQKMAVTAIRGMTEEKTPGQEKVP